MAGISPFTSGTTPLKNAPYFSRIADTNLIDTPANVNYPMLAFKPGYALQASELNEIQDIFYVQKTLSDNLLENWWKTGSNLSLTGVETTPLYGPGWEGAIPLKPTQLIYTDTSPTFKFVPSSDRLWFLITEVNTKFKFWISVDSTAIQNIVFNKTTLPSITFLGIKIQTSFVNCSSASTDAGFIFNDNSTGNYVQNTCGASRFKIELNSSSPFTTQASVTANFLPILKIRKNADTESQNLILIQYMNNYLINKSSS